MRLPRERGPRQQIGVYPPRLPTPLGRRLTDFLIHVTVGGQVRSAEEMLWIANSIQQRTLQHDAAMQNKAVRDHEDVLRKKRAAGEEALQLLERDVAAAVADIERHLETSVLRRMRHL